MARLVIHGHFYQPPRENPWTERVPEEPGAAPFHDWNARVYAECYRPNAFSRVMNWVGQVERIINSYNLMSFNFGPTLLSWMQRSHPETVARIVAADQSSIQRLGHGNAVGQGYNHAILPLCNDRDLRTQIRWGIVDFQHYFGRHPESLWLPETAADPRTLEALMDEGMRFVILSPYQAKRARTFSSSEFSDASGGRVDTSRPYRFFHRENRARYIDVFFYDGQVAQSVAFGGALHSSQELVDRLKSASNGRLIHIATDGETYGHHTKFGDRTLAYALEVLARGSGLEISNYGAVLDELPPTHEIELAEGEDGQGSSWSCAHGLGRWSRDCGCSTGGLPGWNQRWRAPLRAALDRVREHAISAFEDAGRDVFHDPWAARDAYIRVLLDRPTATSPFLSEHVRGELTESRRVHALSLLEMQRNAMLMYTSCGWFFNDISGIETVQVLKYAARVIDLFEELGHTSPEALFLEALAEGESNISKLGNGADIFREQVRPYMVSAPRMAAHLALFDLAVDGVRPPTGDAGGYHYEADYEKRRHGRVALSCGKVTLRSVSTERRYDVQFAAVNLGGADFYCAAGPLSDPESHFRACADLWPHFKTASLPVLLRLLVEGFGPDEFGLEHILPDLRARVSEVVFRGLVRRFEEEYAFLYQDNRRTLEILQSAGFKLPDELRAAAEFTLGRRLEEEILSQGKSRDPEAYKKAIEIADEADRQGLSIARPTSARVFGDMITEAARSVAKAPDQQLFDSAIALIDLCTRLGLRPNLDRAQEAIYLHRTELASVPKAKLLAEKLALSPSIFSGL